MIDLDKYAKQIIAVDLHENNTVKDHQLKKFYKCMGITGLTLLSACGSSGSSDGRETPGATVPQASTGFAVAGETSKAGVTFTKRNTPSHDETGDFSALVANGGDPGLGDLPITRDTLALGSNDVSIAVSDDESQVTLVLNGETYTLDRFVDPEEPEFTLYQFANGTLFADVFSWSVADAAEGFGIEITHDDQSTRILDIIGFDTDPATLAVNTGSATYSGDMFVYGVRLNEESPINGGSDGFDGLDGDLMLTVNFDRNTIAGSGVFDNESPEDPLTETVTFEEIAINGNGFSGAITDDGEFFMPGHTLDDLTYDGNFYGAEGESVAGTLTGEMSIEGEDPLLLLGYFGADEASAEP